MQDDSSPVPSGHNSILTLSELSQSLKKEVETKFSDVRVKAEISRPTKAASGHIYFTLKDDTATLDAVCWKAVAGGLRINPEEGLEVIASGKLTTYAGRSKYQIVIKSLELAGEGALLKQLEDRKQRLMAEGLFDELRKKPLPMMPKTIGVVTSPTGAVIRDILHRLKERFPVQVLIWPVAVQGEGASAEIKGAIEGFDRLLDQSELPAPDLIIVARGGGSLEDLMAFNEEEVVRAAANTRVPIISAVGHETDHTLIDLAADLRAPTPTAAAELATPVKAELEARLSDLESRLTRHLSQRMERSRQQLRDLARALSDPEILLSTKTQQLDLQQVTLDRHIEISLAHALENLRRWADQLKHPGQHLAEAESQTALLLQRLNTSLDKQLAAAATRLDQATRLLDAASFQRVLERGFALVIGPDGQVMRSARTHADGAAIQIKFKDGDRSANLRKPKKQGDLF